MITRGGYGKKIKYRFGFWPKLPPKKNNIKRIWIQAVSVGELLSIHKLLDSFFSNPKVEIVLSGTTSTGQKIAHEKYQHFALALGPFPLDWFIFSSIAWSRIKPDLVVCTDSELWPEHMHQSRKRNIPFCIINGRLSDNSFSRLKRSGPFRELFTPVNLHIFATSENQLSRWKKIGVKESNVITTGNLKVDSTPIEPPQIKQKQERKLEMGFAPNSIVLAGISTWPGEEKFLIEYLKKIRMQKPDVKLLLIPRHAERRNEIVEIIKSHSLSFSQRSISVSDKNNRNPNIYLADTTGELKDLIIAADVGFLGKTLPPKDEGQNPIEATSLGIPLVMGPKASNFSEITKELLQVGSARNGQSPKQIEEILTSLLVDPKKCEKMSKAGLKWRMKQASPTNKTRQALEKILFPND
tara:strand:+ start:3887 stop:5119 length:1233 start_codon:yes stop_codon:yes gene_type:complete